MSEYCEGHVVKIEAGQILNPDSFPTPNELVCIQVPKVFDQAALRSCLTRNVVLSPGVDICRPSFSFKGANNYDITEVKVISKTDSQTRPGFKKLKLSVKVSYDIFYSDGIHMLTQSDEAVFNLTVNEIYCPDCLAQTGVVHYPQHSPGASAETIDTDASLIKVEALVVTFDDVLCACTGALILDIAAFFIVKCECVVQLLIPSYGYCPLPVEQPNIAVQNFATFNDRTKTPFPSQFFPNQKWNPLDKVV